MTLDCSLVSSVKEFLDLYVAQEEVAGKAYLGKNFDALWDALTGYGLRHPIDMHSLTLLGSKSLIAIDDGKFYRKLVKFSKDLEDCSYCDIQILLD